LQLQASRPHEDAGRYTDFLTENRTTPPPPLKKNIISLEKVGNDNRNPLLGYADFLNTLLVTFLYLFFSCGHITPLFCIILIP
jgi:hypothetical protein